MEITEKKLKEILEEQRKEFERYIGVIYKSFQDGFKLLMETMHGIQNELKELKNIVAENTRDTAIIKSDTSLIKSSLK